MSSSPLIIHWFRQDLRLADNPSLCAAVEAGRVLPLYILDEVNAGEHAMGEASRYWLHHALQSLEGSLEGQLNLYRGDPLSILLEVIQRYDVQEVHWNRCYEPWRIKRDREIKKVLEERGVVVKSHNGSLLWEPWTIHKVDGSPYKVFTPFYRKGCLNAPSPRRPLGIPQGGSWVCEGEKGCPLKDLDLLPHIGWDAQLDTHWEISEVGAQKRLEQFIEEGLRYYKEGRNLPDKPFVSRLSPYLHFGQISPNQAWYAVRSQGENKNVDHFCSELGWREFSYSLLYQYPDLPTQNLQRKFDRFPWVKDEKLLRAWQRGHTGIPMVDAGMRELWQTGYMHNRVRMIVASFLVKNLGIHWREGERWFWDTLVDADLANNSASWQWVAGCGADAAPYFRIFNPVTQGQKFDPEGAYVRRFVPELQGVPLKYLFNPWEAPPSLLEAAGLVLGEHYPKPLVDLKVSRNWALEAFAALTPKGGDS